MRKSIEVCIKTKSTPGSLLIKHQGRFPVAKILGLTRKNVNGTRRSNEIFLEQRGTQVFFPFQLVRMELPFHLQKISISSLLSSCAIISSPGRVFLFPNEIASFERLEKKAFPFGSESLASDISNRTLLVNGTCPRSPNTQLYNGPCGPVHWSNVMFAKFQGNTIIFSLLFY